MDINHRIKTFEKFGKLLEEMLNPDPKFDEEDPVLKDIQSRLYDLIQNTEKSNPWFTCENIRLALQAIVGSLSRLNIEQWSGKYMDDLREEKSPLKVGVVMAGNIPLVGFFDLFYVLMSGNIFLGKLSAQDNKLIPLLCEILDHIENGFKDLIEFTEGKLSGFDAVIATGSDNTSRYFDYYFGKYPNIIRQNRNSVAVLSGQESGEEISLLGTDIFSYFGLGCRNVSKLYVPRSFSFDAFFEAIADFKHVINNHKYQNNYDYYKSIYLLNKEKFRDNGFVMLKESAGISSPVSTINFEYYDDLEALKKHLEENNDKIQCIVSDTSVIHESTPFGNTQYPQLWDYADDVDTMKFLINISKSL